jgi:hypothetical protein
MKNLNWLSSWELLDQNCDKFNEAQSENRDRIKGRGYQLGRQLIQLYGYQIVKAGGVDPDHLEPLKTNSTGLGKLLHCHPRTIQRNLKRLEAAGLLSKIVVRSVKTVKIYENDTMRKEPVYSAYYEVDLDPSILVFGSQLGGKVLQDEKKLESADLVNELLISPQSPKPKPIFLSTKTTKSTSLETSSRTKYKRGDSKLQPIRYKDSDIRLTPVKRLSLDTISSASRSKKELEAHKGEKPCQKTPEKNFPAWHGSFPLLLSMCDQLFNFCRVNFYARLDYLSRSQIRSAKIYFLQKLIIDDNYRENYLSLVRGLIIRDEYNKRSHSFTPIPSYFFAAGTKYNFDHTMELARKAKLKEPERIRMHQKFKQVVKIHEFTQAVLLKGEFHNSMNYHDAIKELSQQDPELCNVLNEYVLDLKQTG